MRAIDTNVLVRWFTRDDARQTALADDVMRQPVFVSLTVLIETVWVLQGKVYRFTPQMAGAAVLTLLELRTAVVAAEEDVRWALGRQEAGAHFADMIHLISARGSDSFASFEHRLAEHAGGDPPVPVELLA